MSLFSPWTSFCIPAEEQSQSTSFLSELRYHCVVVQFKVWIDWKGCCVVTCAGALGSLLQYISNLRAGLNNLSVNLLKLVNWGLHKFFMHQEYPVGLGSIGSQFGKLEKVFFFFCTFSLNWTHLSSKVYFLVISVLSIAHDIWCEAVFLQSDCLTRRAGDFKCLFMSDFSFRVLSDFF